MSSIAEQMLKLGFVGEDRFVEHRREAQISEGKAKRDAEKALRRNVTTEALEQAVDVDDFRALAKRFLLDHPEEIADAIRVSHRFNNRHLTGLLFSLRDRLSRCDQNHKAAISQEFRRLEDFLERQKNA